MTDESPVDEEITIQEDERFVAPDPDPAPYQWYQALNNGEVIGEGPSPIPDNIRDQATEIRWSTPKPTSIPDTEAISPEILKALQAIDAENTPPYTPPLKNTGEPNMPREAPQSLSNDSAEG